MFYYVICYLTYYIISLFYIVIFNIASQHLEVLNHNIVFTMSQNYNFPYGKCIVSQIGIIKLGN
jgi:hypothetical protein